jgi:hypothetical protein
VVLLVVVFLVDVVVFVVEVVVFFVVVVELLLALTILPSTEHGKSKDVSDPIFVQ